MEDKNFIEVAKLWFGQHGNAKNADVKRVCYLANNTFVKERWYLVIVSSIIFAGMAAAHERRKDDEHKNDERRKEELHKIQLKKLEEEE